jgi:predicted ATPase
VLTCRPDFVPPWNRQIPLTPLRLDRLNRSQIEQMLWRLTGGKALPALVIEQIAGKTDGVPLFVEELTRMLLESGQLQQTGQGFELTASFDQLAIPLTLQDSLMARLDRLGPGKEIAQWAAVLGREFSHELLAAAVPFAEAALQQGLEALLEAGLLHQRGLAPQARYIFKHALIRDIAYQSLLKRQRQQLHQRTAEVLEARFSEISRIQPELLAWHYTEAGCVQQALPYWQQAGVRAIGRSALREARRHLNNGLKLLRELADTPEKYHQELQFLTTLGPALVALAGQAAAEVEAVYARADQLCLLLGETGQRFAVLWGLWRYSLNRPQLQTAHDVSQQLLTLARQQQDSSMLLEACIACGTTQWYLGNFTGTREHMAQAEALYQPEQHQALAQRFGGCDPGIYCGSYVAITLWHLGYPDQAVQRSHMTIERARQLGQPYTLAFALNFANVLQLYLRDLVSARRGAEELIALATEQGYALWLTVAGVCLAQTRILEGDVAGGMTQLQQSVTAQLATGAELALPSWLGMLAEAYAQNGQIIKGLKALDDALAIVDKSAERQWQAELYRLKGLLLLRHPPDADCAAGEKATVECLQQALAIARRQHSRALELRAAVSLAQLWQQQGMLQQAHDLLAPVYDGFSEGFAVADLQQAKALLAQLTDGVT